MEMPKLSFGVALLAAALLWTPSAPLGAAPQSQQTTFRASANLVEVDVIVQDSEGRFVAGLTRDDFEVLEDGEPQDVQQFYLVAHEGGAFTVARRSSGRAEQPSTNTSTRPASVAGRAGRVRSLLANCLAWVSAWAANSRFNSSC